MTDEDFLECEEGEDALVIKNNIVAANEAIAKAKMELGGIRKVLHCPLVSQSPVVMSERPRSHVLR